MCGIGTDWLAAAHGAEQADVRAAKPSEEGEAKALIIFVKNPVLGKVKTRLAKTMGDQAAYDAYLQMLAHMQQVTAQVEAHRAVYYSDFIDETDAWSSPTYAKHVQAQGDLGDKMCLAIEDMLALGYKRVVLVGSDLLDLQVQHLNEAFRALKFQDFVLGPATDGGYYLIGMNEMGPALFRDKAWSTDSVLQATLADIQKMGKTVHLLRALNDIDEEADWIAALSRQEMRRI